MADMNFLHRFRDIYRNIDRSLDARNRKEFNLACRELQDLVARLRDLIDNTSIADIASDEARHAPRVGRTR
jgi:hypothetical protein